MIKLLKKLYKLFQPNKKQVTTKGVRGRIHDNRPENDRPNAKSRPEANLDVKVTRAGN